MEMKFGQQQKSHCLVTDDWQDKGAFLLCFIRAHPYYYLS